MRERVTPRLSERHPTIPRRLIETVYASCPVFFHKPGWSAPGDAAGGRSEDGRRRWNCKRHLLTCRGETFFSLADQTDDPASDCRSRTFIALKTSGPVVTGPGSVPCHNGGRQVD